MNPLDENEFEDELRRLVTVEPSPEFVARVRKAVDREPARPLVYPRFVPAAAVSVGVMLVVGASLYVRERAASAIVSSPPAYAGADIPLMAETTPPAVPAMPAVRSRRVPVRVVKKDSIPEVIISPADREAFETLVRRVNAEPLILSFEEAGSQRAANESVPDLLNIQEQGAVQ